MGQTVMEWHRQLLMFTAIFIITQIYEKPQIDFCGFSLDSLLYSYTDYLLFGNTWRIALYPTPTRKGSGKQNGHRFLCHAFSLLLLITVYRRKLIHTIRFPYPSLTVLSCFFLTFTKHVVSYVISLRIR